MNKISELLNEYAREIRTYDPRIKPVLPNYFLHQIIDEVSEMSLIKISSSEVHEIGLGGIVFVDRVAAMDIMIKSEMYDASLSFEANLANNKMLYSEESFFSFLVRKALNIVTPVIESTELASPFNRKNLRRFAIHFKGKDATRGRNGEVFIVGVSEKEVTEKFHFITENKNRIISTIDSGYLGIENELFIDDQPYAVSYFDKLKKQRTFKTTTKSALDAILQFYVEKGILNVDNATIIQVK